MPIKKQTNKRGIKYCALQAIYLDLFSKWLSTFSLFSKAEFPEVVRAGGVVDVFLVVVGCCRVIYWRVLSSEPLEE